MNENNIKNTDYNPKEVIIDSDLSKFDQQLNIKNKNFTFAIDLVFLSIMANTTSDFNKICGLCIKSKSTQTIL